MYVYFIARATKASFFYCLQLCSATRAQDHKDPSTGDGMHCDRKIILQCIRTWLLWTCFIRGADCTGYWMMLNKPYCISSKPCEPKKGTFKHPTPCLKP